MDVLYDNGNCATKTVSVGDCVLVTNYYDDGKISNRCIRRASDDQIIGLYTSFDREGLVVSVVNYHLDGNLLDWQVYDCGRLKCCAKYYPDKVVKTYYEGLIPRVETIKIGEK